RAPAMARPRSFVDSSPALTLNHPPTWSSKPAMPPEPSKTTAKSNDTAPAPKSMPEPRSEPAEPPKAQTPAPESSDAADNLSDVALSTLGPWAVLLVPDGDEERIYAANLTEALAFPESSLKSARTSVARYNRVAARSRGKGG